MLTAADLYATLTSPLSPIYAQTTEERDLATEIQLVNHLVAQYLQRNQQQLRQMLSTSPAVEIDLDYAVREHPELPPLLPNRAILTDRSVAILPEVAIAIGAQNRLQATVVFPSFDASENPDEQLPFLSSVPYYIPRQYLDIRIGIATSAPMPGGVPVFTPAELGAVPIAVPEGSFVEQILS